MPHILAQTSGKSLGQLHSNLSVPVLYERAVRNEGQQIAANGALIARTGSRTGRSPKDKWVVEEPASKAQVWWGKVNQPMSEETYDRLFRRTAEYLCGRDLYVLDAWAGAHPRHRLALRVINEMAWHNLFARQLFLRTTPEEQKIHQPEWRIFSAPRLKADPKRDGVNSEVAVCIHFARKQVLIVGTEYAGEMKKSIFTVLNYILPQRDVFPMHCSANVGANGDVALFFGLSGTGKTSLSADPQRGLIGDDEHGWGEEGVFNFEGGCYAKCIRLTREKEPQIWDAMRFGAVIENVVVDPVTREPQYADDSITENTRAAYPLDFIANAIRSGRGGHPKAVIFLSCDAFGVLPPVAKLTPEQAMYHFMSGYTASLAGTEANTGREPVPTFSTCFGAPFLPLPPTTYARMLAERLRQHNASCWLINTGWTTGAYNETKRIPIQYNRDAVTAVLTGKLDAEGFDKDPFFGIAIPRHCPGIPDAELQPRRMWKDQDAYDLSARDLAAKFRKNFEQFKDASPAILQAGPQG
ncbi:MAG: phosphoenolpyruvate carboxykinase (ATP) [Verrucomicrobia bacterium]|nr:phosphoenolpyruvate carboxykinase (ATP) [Verrucomicrobiota bacterium]